MTLTLLLVLQDALVLHPTTPATEAQLERCATAIVARCTLYGYKDVQADLTLDRKALKITCPTGLSYAMKHTVPILASRAGQSHELRLVRELSAAEAEKYAAHDQDPSKDTAPPGSKWHRWAIVDQPHLLGRALVIDTPAFNSTDLLPRSPTSYRPCFHFEFSASARSKISSDLSVVHFVDGAAWGSGTVQVTSGSKGSPRIQYVPAGHTYLSAILTFPMPLAFSTNPPK